MKNTLKHIRLAPLLAEEILKRIWSGRYPAGTRLASIRELRKEFPVGKHSLESAVAMLACNGYLKRHAGRTPLIRMDRRSGVYRIAMCDFRMPERRTVRYETSPRSWLFKDAVAQALRRRNCHCVSIGSPEELQAVAPVVDGLIQFIFIDRPVPPICGFAAPVLTVKNTVEEPLTANTLYTERDQALEKAAYYMISHGIRSLVSLQRGSDPLHNEREKHLRRILRNFGWSGNPVQTLATGEVMEKNAVGPLRAFLHKKPPLPLGVLAQGDLLARGAAGLAVEMGLRLKKDIVIIGCTGIPEAADWRPAVTSLTSPFQAMGKCAAEGILRLIAGEKELPPRIVHGQLLIRET